MVQVYNIHFLKLIPLMCTSHRLAHTTPTTTNKTCCCHFSSKREHICSSKENLSLLYPAQTKGFCHRDSCQTPHLAFTPLAPTTSILDYCRDFSCPHKTATMVVPIEDATDNCHFKGWTGGGELPCCAFNASQKHNGVCKCVSAEDSSLGSRLAD